MITNSLTAGEDIGELFPGSDVCTEADSAMGLSGKEGLSFPAESTMCEDQEAPRPRGLLEELKFLLWVGRRST